MVQYLFLGALDSQSMEEKMVTDIILKKENILTHLVHYIFSP